MEAKPNIARLHHELIQVLIHHGACPTNTELAATLNTNQTSVENLLQELAAIHGVVLHPHIPEPWILHPFSLTPTLNCITSASGVWWAPCVWCAMGVAVLVGGATRIHARYGAEAEPLVIEVNDGVPANPDIWVHFAIPPARAWDNVHQHCSLVLPFHSPKDIQDWCRRHAVPMGEPVPLTNVARLARAWYGTHASPEWRKWTVAEAQEIFSQAGLTSDFWQLQPRRGAF